MEEIKDKPKKLALGLDLGVASCGWSLLDITDPNNMQLVDLGVRLFDEACPSGKSADTNAAKRRDKRSLRRRLRRFRFRKNNLIDLFGKYNILPGNNFEERKDNFCKIIENMDVSTNPLDLKLKGLKGSLETDELAIVLYSYMQHRGFFYDIEEDDSNTKLKNEDKTNLTNIREQLKTKLPSEIQKEHWNEFGKYIGLNENSQFSNKDWTKEIEVLFAKQDQNKVPEKFQKEYLSLFNYIRPFNIGPGNKNSPTPYGLYREEYNESTKEFTVVKIGDNLWDQTIGKCSVYPDQNREFRNAPLTEIFNLINDVNNIKVLADGKMLPLTADQKKIFYSEVDALLLKDALKNKSAPNLISPASLLKIIKKSCANDELKFDDNSIIGVKFELKDDSKDKKKEKDKKETLKKKEIIVDQTKFMYAIASFLLDCGIIKTDDLHLIKNNKFNNDLIDKLQEVFHILANAPLNKEERIKDLNDYLNKNNVPNQNELASKLVDFLSSGLSQTASLSEKAMLQFCDNNWDKQLNASAYFYDQIFANTKKGIPISKYLSKKLFSKEILSVDARRMFIQAINVINKILKLWCYKKGYQLASITIEMPRDKNSDAEKKEIKRLQKENKEFKDRVIKECELTENDLNNGQKFLKAYLWDQQNHMDLYDGKPIDLNILLNQPSAYQIDHAIPYSLSGIDSLTNKVLTSTDNNRNKNNRTPYQWLGEKFKDFKDRVIELYADHKITANKRNLLLREQKDWEGFIGRNLSDTRYGTSVLLNALQAFFAKNNQAYKTKIIATNGAMTHYARNNLFIDENKKPIILTKDRAINNHHAIDATIIAYLGNNPKIRAILEWYRKQKNNPENDQKLINPVTGEIFDIDDQNDIDTFYGLKNEATKKLGELLNRIDKNIDDNFYVKFSRPVYTHNSNFGLFDDTIYRYKKIQNEEYSISKINLLQKIDEKELKKWTQYFSNGKKGNDALVFDVNDPIYLKLKEIFNDPRYNKQSKDQKEKAINPFLNYVDELRKEGVIDSNLFIPIYKNNTKVDSHPTYVRFLRVKSTISSFYGKSNDKNGYKWIKTGLNASSVRFYKNKSNKKIAISMNIHFLKFNKKKQILEVDEDLLSEYLKKENIDPASKYFTLYYGSTLSLNNKFMEKIKNADNVNNKAFSTLIPKISFNPNYVRFFSLGTANTPSRIEVKFLNISVPIGDNRLDSKILKGPFYLGLDFLNDYVDYIEVDPLGNIYNRKSFKEIFNQLGTPKNN